MPLTLPQAALPLAVQLGGMEAEPLLRAALDHGASVVELSVVEPTMRDLFVREVEGAA